MRNRYCKLSCVHQMLFPVSQLINGLHSLKNSATASIQTLNRDLIPEHNANLREVRCHSHTVLRDH